MATGSLLALRRTGGKDTGKGSGKPEGTWRPLERGGKVVGADKPSNTQEKGF